jgi:hypothetical protein
LLTFHCNHLLVQIILCPMMRRERIMTLATRSSRLRVKAAFWLVADCVQYFAKAGKVVSPCCLSDSLLLPCSIRGSKPHRWIAQQLILAAAEVQLDVPKLHYEWI